MRESAGGHPKGLEAGAASMLWRMGPDGGRVRGYRVVGRCLVGGGEFPWAVGWDSEAQTGAVCSAIPIVAPYL